MRQRCDDLLRLSPIEFLLQETENNPCHPQRLAGQRRASAWSVAKPAAPRSTAPSRLSRPARDPNATEPEELDAAADQFGRRAAWTDRRGSLDQNDSVAT